MSVMAARKRKIIELDDNVHATALSKAKKTSATAKSHKLPFPDQFTRFGHLLSCGQNEVGQLGFDENVSERTRPALVPSAKDAKIVDISAGGMHSVYLTLDGDVWSFGCNDEGALGRDTSEDGSEYECRMVKLPEKCIRVTAGDSHSAFLLNDGRVFACGSFRDSHGTMGLNIKGKQQFPIDVVPNEVFVDIKSGADHLVMLSNKGKVFTVGCAEQGQLGRISTRSSSGETRRGKTELLKPGLLPTLKLGFIDAIWTTTYCTFVRKRSSTQIFAFGLNNYHQLGIKTKTSEALFTPQLTPFTNVKSIAGGQHHTLVLTNDNKCFAIGRKDYGRLGLGDVEGEDVDTLTPIQALNNFNVAQLDCGEACSFAVLDNGQIYSWGIGSNLQLGIGSEDDQTLPQLLTGAQVKDREVFKVSSGGQHTLFIAADKLNEQNKANGVAEKPVATTTAATKKGPAATATKKDPAATTSKNEPSAATSKKEPAATTAKKESAATTAKKESAATTANKEPAAATTKKETASITKTNGKK